MLNSSDANQVTAAVTVLAANAQALGALTVVRALADCKGTPMSNELYAQVCGSHVVYAAMRSVQQQATYATSLRDRSSATAG
jgi:hypothetical protein